MQSSSVTRSKNGAARVSSEPKHCEHLLSVRRKLSPKELAAQWGTTASRIIGLIRTGELAAIDAAVNRGRPRFLIDLADIAIFEERRMINPPRPVPRARQWRREKAEPAGPKYF